MLDPEFSVIFRGNGLYHLQKLGHLFLVELGWRRSTRRYRNFDFEEERVIPRWRADTDHPDWA